MTSASKSQGDRVHCPFTNYDGCHDGVGGRVYVRSAIYRHLKDMHFPNNDAMEVCRVRIRTNLDCFNVWERFLGDIQLWICLQCLHTHAWRKACRDPIHISEVINGPFNGNGVDFLIHGAEKPQPQIPRDVVDANVGEEMVVGILTIELLDLLFQRQIPTTVSIPPPCRLQFSRTQKASLDNVIANPLHLCAWLHLLLLPVCTLNLYMPKSSIEERSGTRKKLQIAAINQALVTWNEPNGCYSMVQKILDLFTTNHQ